MANHFDHPPCVGIIVPCFNEEEIIVESLIQLQGLLCSLKNKHKISRDSFLLFVDDGSSDNTLGILKNNASETVKVLRLSKNTGHQFALLAGMHFSIRKADCIITVDADLQDDIFIIPKMIDIYNKGVHIVYGVRKERRTDSYFKRNSARSFYWLLKKMSVKLVCNHADFRLLSNDVLIELVKYKEVNLFLRGIIPQMGFKSEKIYYDRKRRIGGHTKYHFQKMFALAINGITSFSIAPLRFISFMGAFLFFCSLISCTWVIIIVQKGESVPGWASIVAIVSFLGGIQLLALGVIGEYIGKIFMETKQRPPYHIEEIME